MNHAMISPIPSKSNVAIPTPNPPPPHSTRGTLQKVFTTPPHLYREFPSLSYTLIIAVNHVMMHPLLHS